MLLLLFILCPDHARHDDARFLARYVLRSHLVEELVLEPAVVTGFGSSVDINPLKDIM